MNFYSENNNIGMTHGQVSLSNSQWESSYIQLDQAKHPTKVRPTVVLTPQGDLANVNAHAQVRLVPGAAWEFKVYTSDGVAEAAGTIKVNYVVISSWAN